MHGSPSLRVPGPLEVHAQGLWDELMRLGYSVVSARSHLRLASDLGRWLEARRVPLREFTDARAAAFLRERRRRGQAPLFTWRALVPLLGFLRRAGAVPPATADGSPEALLLTEYTAYLVSERGLAASTVHAYTEFARRFIAEERPRLDWQRMTVAHVTRFVLRTARRVTPPTSKFFVTCLRALLRFLHVRGMTALNLASGVPAVAGWRLSGIPKAIEAGQVDRVLSSFDGSPVGLRGAAIVRLLVRLGLRAGEVAALDLEDIDWRAAELTVRGKSQRDSRLPLPPDIGQALTAYLQWGRPQVSTRALFLWNRAPFTRLSPCAVCMVARRALAAVGIRGGAHRFRHTAATELLRGGASLPEIADVLRHRSLDTTAIYAKVDLAALSAVAHRWPGGVR